MITISSYKRKKIIFVGNSIFNKDGSNTLGQKYISNSIRTNLIALGYTNPVFDYSISGQTITQMLSAFTSGISIMIAPKDIVVFTEMTNEIGANSATALATKNLIIEYRDLVWALGGKFVIQGAIACNSGSVPGYANLTATIQSCNDYFRNDPGLCDSFADCGALTQCDADADCANATYYNSDGIHPTTTLEDLMIPVTQTKIINLI